VLLLAPLAALVAAAFASEPLLARWTQTFMGSAAQFVAQFFPLFLLGALFGKLMEDCGAVEAIAAIMTKKLGARRAVLAVVLASAIVTYGGASLFVAYFVLAPMAAALFRAADIPRRLMPAAIMLGSSTFTMSALPGTPAIPNNHPHALLRHHDLRRTRSRDYSLRHHDRDRTMVAAPCEGEGTPARRGLSAGTAQIRLMPPRTTP
jgi:H+/gluconate symporter-like permease